MHKLIQMQLDVQRERKRHNSLPEQFAVSCAELGIICKADIEQSSSHFCASRKQRTIRLLVRAQPKSNSIFGSVRSYLVGTTMSNPFTIPQTDIDTMCSQLEPDPYTIPQIDEQDDENVDTV